MFICVFYAKKSDKLYKCCNFAADIHYLLLFFYKTRKIMERRLSLFFVCLMISIGAAFAQMDVSGTVVSQDDGEPIIGASVSISGGGKICRYCHRY